MLFRSSTVVTAVLETRSWATRSVDTSAAPRTTVGLTEAAPPRAEFHAAGVVPSVGAGLGAVPGTTVVRISSRELIRAMGEIGGATPDRGSEAAQHHRLGDQIEGGVFTELDALRKSDVMH